MAHDSRRRTERLNIASQVFTPGAPIKSHDLFCGRSHLLRDIGNAIGQAGLHVALYGERGVGKTSLAYVLPQTFFVVATHRLLTSVRVACNTGSTFGSLWRTVFRRLGVTDGPDHEADFTPDLVCEHLERQEQCFIVIDEFDRLEDQEAVSLFADTIKELSDSASHITLALVGVADSIDELVGDHRSVERALVQIRMPKMSLQELTEIINNGVARLDMTATRNAVDRIARLSEGLPFYTHLVGLYAAQSAIMDDRGEIKASDVDNATQLAVEKSQQSIVSDYEKAIRSPRPDNIYAQVLLACALAPKDGLGCFRPSGVREPLARIMKKKYEIGGFARHLSEFCKDARGPILRKRGEPRRFFYRFENPLLQPFVILSGLSRGLISESTLASFRP